MAEQVSNLAALEETLSELRRLGRLEAIDAAEVQAVRSMAAQLDVKASNAMLWKVYGEALERLTADGDENPAVADLIEKLQSEPRDTSAS